MLKRILKSLFAGIVLLGTSQVFADDWFVCLGSFKNEDLAMERLQILADKELPAFISEFTSSDGTPLYRILFSEPFSEIEDARTYRDAFSENPVLEEIGIRDLWCTQSSGVEKHILVVEKTVEVEKTIEVIKEVPVEKTVEVIKEVPVEVEKIVEVVKEVPVEKTVEVIKEVPVEVVKTVEVIKEVPVEKIVEVIKEVPVPTPAPEPAPVVEIVPPAPEPAPAPMVNREKRTIVIKDSDTGAPIPDASVNIDRIYDTGSDANGKVVLPDELEDGAHSVVVSKNDYVTTVLNLNLSNGELKDTEEVSIPKSVDYERIKIVLDWGKKPDDLDAHLRSGWKHVWYGNKKAGNMRLDRDDKDSYGPETITLEGFEKDSSYQYYVYNFSDIGRSTDRSLSNSDATVSVYLNNEFKRTFKIKPNQIGTKWHVFDIVNGSEIVEKNIIY